MTRILVVDDVRDAAETLGTLFDAMGHETRLAFDGRTAVDTIRRFRPQIVFLDLAMPVMDGYAAAAAIRLLAGVEQPFLIALTGSSGAQVEADVKAVGFDAYLRKPVDTMTMIAVVTEIAARV